MHLNKQKEYRSIHTLRLILILEEVSPTRKKRLKMEGVGVNVKAEKRAGNLSYRID